MHPIALDNQIYFLPGNAEPGDELGEVNYLFTFCRFWNEYKGTDLTEDQFIFLKVSGPNNFSVNPVTGMLYLANSIGLNGNTSVVVQVSIGGMHMNVTCRILFIPTVDCIYFDPDYTGENGESNGTRNRPYLKYEQSREGFGTAGKTYLYRRGTTIRDQSAMFNNPKVGGVEPKYINVCAWGKGPRPIFTDTGSLNRTFTLGRIPWGNAPVDPALTCNNFRLFDIETYKEVADRWYPILVKPSGENIHMGRFKGSNTLFDNGILYFPAITNDHQGVEPRNIYLESFELHNAANRAIKIETSGVKCYNFRCKNDGSLGPTGSPAPTCAHKPLVEFKYIDVEVENSREGSLGFQCRGSRVVHQWVWAKGLRYVMTPFVHRANDGWGGEYLMDETCIFDHFIIENCYQASYFGRHEGTTDVVDGLRFTNIKIISARKGIEVAQGAKNILVAYSDLSRCSDGDGYRVYASAGIGNKLHNSTIFDCSSQDIELQRTGVEITNTNYGVIAGAANATITTSSNSKAGNLIGAGTPLGYLHDLKGNPVANPPSIGAYELAENVPDPSSTPSL